MFAKSQQAVSAVSIQKFSKRKIPNENNFPIG
jgi:hypothetical protein